jgi:uncharacterized protein (DUF2252 family)
MLEHLMEGYEQALNSDGGRIPLQKPDSVKVVIRSAVKRTWKELAKERIENTQPTIPLGKNFWPLSNYEKNGISKLVETQEILGLVTSLKSRNDGAKVKVLDAAYWVKGCSSLGLLRYVVLLSVGGDNYCLIDIKEAVQAAAPRYQHISMPRDNARRVVEGARQMSPALGERMIAQR